MNNKRGTQMQETYRAVEVSEPGVLRVVERPLPEPGPGQVRIRVEACGICHTDAATVTGTYPGLKLPRVPGHEVVGRIDAFGSGVSRWKTGQRVGIGFFGGEDGTCEPCRRGDIVNCQNAVTPGVTVDGGYAEVMIAEARGIASIPDELTSVDAAPLLCAGITTYNALRNAGLRGGDLVAVQGIGGLGHLGIQFARHMGFRTVAIGRGGEKAELAKKLGAHVYVDTAVEDAAAALQRLGGARAVLATAPSGDAMGPLVSGLGARGKLIVVGVPLEPMQLSAFPLVFGGRSIYGSLAGTAIETEDALAFSVLENIRPMIETVPFERAAEAYDRMMKGKARFRMVRAVSFPERRRYGLSFPALPSFLRSPSNVSLSSFERTPAASSIAAACSRKVLVMSARPFAVSSTRRTRRSSVFLRFTSAFFSSRSTATLIDPGLSHTLGPIVLTGSVPLWSSTSSTRKSESPRPAPLRFKLCDALSDKARNAFASTNQTCTPDVSCIFAASFPFPPASYH